MRKACLFSLGIFMIGCSGQVAPNGDVKNVSSSSVNPILYHPPLKDCVYYCIDGGDLGSNPWQTRGLTSGYVITGSNWSSLGGYPVIGVDTNYNYTQDQSWYGLYDGSLQSWRWLMGVPGTLNLSGCQSSTLQAIPWHPLPNGAPPPGGSGPGGKGDPRLCDGYEVCIDDDELTALRDAQSCNYTVPDPPVHCHGRFCQ